MTPRALASNHQNYPKFALALPLDVIAEHRRLLEETRVTAVLFDLNGLHRVQIARDHEYMEHQIRSGTFLQLTETGLDQLNTLDADPSGDRPHASPDPLDVKNLRTLDYLFALVIVGCVIWIVFPPAGLNLPQWGRFIAILVLGFMGVIFGLVRSIVRNVE